MAQQFGQSNPAARLEFYTLTPKFCLPLERCSAGLICEHLVQTVGCPASEPACCRPASEGDWQTYKHELALYACIDTPIPVLGQRTGCGLSISPVRRGSPQLGFVSCPIGRLHHHRVVLPAGAKSKKFNDDQTFQDGGHLLSSTGRGSGS